ncbi:MAG TPA: phospholipase D family protein [Pyrinomonadaceae bacterium]|jgi:HKD family nuclease
MALFYNQPSAHRFGVEVIKELESGSWNVFEVGVAWVRRSGMKHILPALRAFLHSGGIFRITVGIDIHNTSKEGLEDLLSLGGAEIFVYHDEADTTFHPKVYLLHDGTMAKLIVGSNNITESGLFVNTEAGLEINAPLTEPAIQDALAGLAAWRDPSERLSLPLDNTLLSDLVLQGYVLPETSLSRPRRSSKTVAGGAKASRVLFGRTKVSRPPAPPSASTSASARTGTSAKAGRSPIRGATAGGTPSSSAHAVATSATASSSSSVGRVLLMRVRKASETDRPTQTQLPKTLYNDQFFSGVTAITSAHDGRSHELHEAKARGIVNTLKLEIPEMRTFSDPVIRLERTSSGIIYQAFDAASSLGRPIMAALERGRTMSPPTTSLTKPKSPETSTWWRFI